MSLSGQEDIELLEALVREIEERFEEIRDLHVWLGWIESSADHLSPVVRRARLRIHNLERAQIDALPDPPERRCTMVPVGERPAADRHAGS